VVSSWQQRGLRWVLKLLSYAAVDDLRKSRSELGVDWKVSSFLILPKGPEAEEEELKKEEEEVLG